MTPGPPLDPAMKQFGGGGGGGGGAGGKKKGRRKTCLIQALSLVLRSA